MSLCLLNILFPRFIFFLDSFFLAIPVVFGMVHGGWGSKDKDLDSIAPPKFIRQLIDPGVSMVRSGPPATWFLCGDQALPLRDLLRGYHDTDDMVLRALFFPQI